MLQLFFEVRLSLHGVVIIFHFVVYFFAALILIHPVAACLSGFALRDMST